MLTPLQMLATQKPTTGEYVLANLHHKCAAGYDQTVGRSRRTQSRLRNKHCKRRAWTSAAQSPFSVNSTSSYKSGGARHPTKMSPDVSLSHNNISSSYITRRDLDCYVLQAINWPSAHPRSATPRCEGPAPTDRARHGPVRPHLAARRRDFKRRGSHARVTGVRHRRAHRRVAARQDRVRTAAPARAG